MMMRRTRPIVRDLPSQILGAANSSSPHYLHLWQCKLHSARVYHKYLRTPEFRPQRTYSAPLARKIFLTAARNRKAVGGQTIHGGNWRRLAPRAADFENSFPGGMHGGPGDHVGQIEI